MGGGHWDAATYDSVTASAIASGTSFGYSTNTAATQPRADWKAHGDLEPKDVKFRESRDSDDHPNSLPIAVLFDVTGSMHTIPGVLQGKLGELFGLLVRKGYAEDPQVLFGAIGDATCDPAPLQVGQFESDNRADENLDNVLLTGGGGGSNQESYELALYFMARHTALDSIEKRNKKGYLFIIGDEHSYDYVKAHEVERVIGDDLGGEDIPVANIVAEVTEKYEVFFIVPAGSAHANDPALAGFWEPLIPGHVIQVSSVDEIAELIALAVGVNEGNVDLDQGIKDLETMGFTGGEALGQTLAGVGATSTTPSTPGITRT